MITLKKIVVSLGDKAVLKSVSLHVPEDSLVTLSGASGGGKSTLLKTVIGWHLPKSGEVHIDHLLLTPANLTKIRSRLHYMPQEIMATGDETVMEFIHLPFTLKINRHLNFDKSMAYKMATRLNLDPELLTHPMSTLSGGERKRIGLLRGLLLGRKIHLLDEPTAGIDAENRTRVLQILTELDGTVLCVSHDPDLMNNADQHFQLDGGTVTKQETCHERA